MHNSLSLSSFHASECIHLGYNHLLPNPSPTYPSLPLPIPHQCSPIILLIRHPKCIILYHFPHFMLSECIHLGYNHLLPNPSPTLPLPIPHQCSPIILLIRHPKCIILYHFPHFMLLDASISVTITSSPTRLLPFPSPPYTTPMLTYHIAHPSS